MDEYPDAASSPCAATEADWGFEAGSTLCVLVLAGGQGARIGGAKPERTLAGRRLIDRAIQIARKSGGRVAVGLRAPDQLDGLEGLHTVLDQSGIEGPMASLAAGYAWANSAGAEYLQTLPCDAPFAPQDLAARLMGRLQRRGVAVDHRASTPPPLEGEGVGGWDDVQQNETSPTHFEVVSQRHCAELSSSLVLSPPPLPLPPLGGGGLVCSGVASGAGSVGVVLPESQGRLHPSCGMWRTSVIDQLPDYLSSGKRSLIGFAEHIGYAVEDWGAPARDPFFNINTLDDLSTAEKWLAQPHFE